VKESKVEGHLVKRVKETGGITRKAQWIAHHGCPDRWCGWPAQNMFGGLLGRNGWVETKKPATPEAADHQAREHLRMRACGARVDVLATIEEVDAYIKEMTGE
jgi:hypothetical protein